MEDIFYQIPEICSLHERFLLQISQRTDRWHALQKIGDVFVNTVRAGDHYIDRRVVQGLVQTTSTTLAHYISSLTVESVEIEGWGSEV